MAYKISLVNNYVFVQDTETDVLFEALAKDVIITRHSLNSEIFRFQGFRGTEAIPEKINLSDLVDANANPFTLESFQAWYTENTGFNTAAGGSAAISGEGSSDQITNIWVGTQAEYDALTLSSTTLYFIK